MVKYETNESGRRKIKILKSFGRDRIANYLKAKQFEFQYNTLKAIIAEPKIDTVEKLVELQDVVITMFGAVLGYKLIKQIFGEHEKWAGYDID